MKTEKEQHSTAVRPTDPPSSRRTWIEKNAPMIIGMSVFAILGLLTFAMYLINT